MRKWMRGQNLDSRAEDALYKSDADLIRFVRGTETVRDVHHLLVHHLMVRHLMVRHLMVRHLMVRYSVKKTFFRR